MSTLSRRDRLIPWYFVAFFLAIVLVDGTMAMLAVRTRTGLVTDHAYEKGLTYNRTIAATETQEKLGWKAEIEAKNNHLTVALTDASGKKLNPDMLRAHFYRPASDTMDFDVVLKNGAADIAPPATGLWEVRIYATVGGKTFQQAKRLVL